MMGPTTRVAQRARMRRRHPAEAPVRSLRPAVHHAQRTGRLVSTGMPSARLGGAAPYPSSEVKDVVRQLTRGTEHGLRRRITSQSQSQSPFPIAIARSRNESGEDFAGALQLRPRHVLVRMMGQQRVSRPEIRRRNAVLPEMTPHRSIRPWPGAAAPVFATSEASKGWPSDGGAPSAPSMTAQPSPSSSLKVPERSWRK